MSFAAVVPKQAGRCTFNRLINQYIRQHRSPHDRQSCNMSFYRNNKNYSDSDKFAWEVAEEAMGTHQVNNTATLKQTSMYFAELNHTEQFGRQPPVGFAAKSHTLPFGHMENILDKLPQPREIRMPKRVTNFAPDFPDRHPSGHVIDGLLPYDHELYAMHRELVPTLPEANQHGM